MRNLDEIIIHCAATPPDWMEGKSLDDKAAEIRRWHVEDNGWKDIGYHTLIDRDGATTQGRADEVAGAHTKGHNTTSLGVCLIGGRGSNENDAFSDHFTPEQDRALRMWIGRKQDRYPTIKKISGHNEYAAKACPGFPVARWLKGKPPVTGSPAKSKEVQVSAGQVVGGAATAVTAAGALDGTAQIALIGVGCLIAVGGLILMRKEIREWVRKRAS